LNIQYEGKKAKLKSNFMIISGITAFSHSRKSLVTASMLHYMYFLAPKNRSRDRKKSAQEEEKSENNFSNFVL